MWRVCRHSAIGWAIGRVFFCYVIFRVGICIFLCVFVLWFGGVPLQVLSSVGGLVGGVEHAQRGSLPWWLLWLHHFVRCPSDIGIALLAGGLASAVDWW